MSLWSRLFGGGGGETSDVPPEMYRDFAIYPEPAKVAGGYRIAARIEKDVDGEVKRHHLIRADVCNSLEEAIQASAAKARALIDQQGMSIFD